MEYPFKDLLPLDEVLEREGYYKDWTHLDPKVFYSLAQISEYIKTKGFGVDVRLLIAQLAEHFGLKTTQVVDLANLLQQKFDNLEGVTQSFTNNINSLVAQMEADKNAVIANATVDSEVILARGGKATLGERLDETATQLTETKNQLPKRKRIIIEEEEIPHLENFKYTAFISGANISGREVHVARAGLSHEAHMESAYVAYIKENDGTFTRKKINGIDYSIGDFRDPNLSVSPRGTAILTGAVKLIDGTYSNYYYTLNDNLDVVNALKMNGMDGRFSFGNTLSNSESKTIKAAYLGGSVDLFENKGVAGSMDMVKVATLFPDEGESPTECTIGFWGDKLVAITRQNQGNMLYRETLDLTGRSGWGDIVDLGFIADAPCIQTYTKADEPLILTASYEEDRNRVPFIIKFYDPKEINNSQMFFIDTLNRRGGYNSLVKNENGYGLMYYEDGANHWTNVYYQEVDIDSIGNNIDSLNIISQKPFYETGTWDPEINNLTNIDSYERVSNGSYTRIGRFVVAQVQIEQLRPQAEGVLSFVFKLPINRGKSPISGNIFFVHTNVKGSSVSVGNYSSTNYEDGVGSVEVSLVRSGTLYLSVYYQV